MCDGDRGLVEVEEDEVGEQVEEDQPDLEEEEAVMGVVAEHDLVVADVLGGGLGLLLCARYIVLLDEEEDEVAAEVAQKPHRRDLFLGVRGDVEVGEDEEGEEEDQIQVSDAVDDVDVDVDLLVCGVKEYGVSEVQHHQ